MKEFHQKQLWEWLLIHTPGSASRSKYYAALYINRSS